MFIELYYWKYSGDRGPHVGRPCFSRCLVQAASRKTSNFTFNSQQREGIFFLFKSVQICSVAHPTSCSVGTGGPVPGV